MVTLETIQAAHKRLQYDDDFYCECLKSTPKTAEGLINTCGQLKSLYNIEARLVILAWSAAESLLKAALDQFWSSNLQPFKAATCKPLFEYGHVGDLQGVPVIASIYASSDYAIVTGTADPLQIEINGHNSILACW